MPHLFPVCDYIIYIEQNHNISAVSLILPRSAWLILAKQQNTQHRITYQDQLFVFNAQQNFPK